MTPHLCHYKNSRLHLRMKMSSKAVLSGRNFSSKEIDLVKEHCSLFKNLSRRELALTICENISWLRPNGTHKVDSCLVALEKLSTQGLISLPAKRTRNRKKSIVQWTDRSLEQPEISSELGILQPIELRVVSSQEDRNLWNEYVDRHHYLKYARPIGNHIRYFIVSNASEEKILGCLLFSSAAWSIKSRDEFIGWDKRQREKLLQLVVNNNRFLIFPWVKVPNLASHVLGLAAKRIQGDWQNAFCFRPVLLETFVDTTLYTGNCYKAANWQLIGETSGRARTDRLSKSRKDIKSVKNIFLYPLESEFSNYLTEKRVYKQKRRSPRNGLVRKKDGISSPDEAFVSVWKKIIEVVSEVAEEYDKKWQKRKRVLNSMILVLLIFRLICSQRRGYNINISELWDNCEGFGLSLPQDKPVSASSFSEARNKLDANIFKEINTKVLDIYKELDRPQHKWHGYNLYAVDGSKVFVPRSLFGFGYAAATTNRYYPQALVSCLYQVKSKIPVDFDFSSKMDERKCAAAHLLKLTSQDIVVYDRGYFSFDLLYSHINRGVNAIFRVHDSILPEFEKFTAGEESDKTIEITPVSPNIYKPLKEKFPNISKAKIRLVKYKHGQTTYTLATTLDSSEFSIEDFSEAYHARWGVEELYKVSKTIFSLEDFHSGSENGVKQEVFANFVMITLNRLFANESDDFISNDYSKISQKDAEQYKWQTNFKNCTTTIARNLENLFLSSSLITKTVTKIFSSISKYYATVRPERSYPRASMKPGKKWKEQHALVN